MTELMRRRRAIMGAQKDEKEYLIKSGVVQDIIGSFEKKGYIRGSGTITLTQDTDCLKVIHNFGQTVSETSTKLVFPNGKQKLKVRAKLEDVMSGSGTYITIAKTVTTATTINNAYSDYIYKNLSSDTITELEYDLTNYQTSGFYFSVTMDTWSSKYRTLDLYDVWME